MPQSGQSTEEGDTTHHKRHSGSAAAQGLAIGHLYNRILKGRVHIIQQASAWCGHPVWLSSWKDNRLIKQGEVVCTAHSCTTRSNLLDNIRGHRPTPLVYVQFDIGFFMDWLRPSRLPATNEEPAEGGGGIPTANKGSAGHFSGHRERTDGSRHHTFSVLTVVSQMQQSQGHHSLRREVHHRKAAQVLKAPQVSSKERAEQQQLLEESCFTPKQSAAVIKLVRCAVAPAAPLATSESVGGLRQQMQGLSTSVQWSFALSALAFVLSVFQLLQRSQALDTRLFN